MESCANLKTLSIGQYFKARCEVAKCSNAPTGYYYTGSGDTSNTCPFKACDPVTKGQRFVPGWATSSSSCPIEKCADLEAGYDEYRAGNCTRIACSGAKRGEYYTSPGKCKEVGKCTNKRANQYYVSGWSNSASTCPVNTCDQTPAPGLYREGNATACEVKECTNAPVGNYYTSAGSNGNNCKYEACTNADKGAYYTEGFRTTNSCPTKPCDPARLPKGHYFHIDNSAKQEADRCQAKACPAKPGYYFTDKQAIVMAQCGGIMTACTNAGIGERYIQGPSDASPVVSNNCPTESCLGEVGFYYTKAGSCSHKKECTNAPNDRALYNSSGGNNNECQFKKCAEPAIGQKYKYNPPNRSNACELENCSHKKGFKFTSKGKCELLKCQNQCDVYVSKDDCACKATVATPVTTQATTTTPDPGNESVVITAVGVTIGIVLILGVIAAVVLLRHRIFGGKSDEAEPGVEMGPTDGTPFDQLLGKVKAIGSALLSATMLYIRVCLLNGWRLKVEAVWLMGQSMDQWTAFVF